MERKFEQTAVRRSRDVGVGGAGSQIGGFDKRSAAESGVFCDSRSGKLLWLRKETRGRWCFAKMRRMQKRRLLFARLSAATSAQKAQTAVSAHSRTGQPLFVAFVFFNDPCKPSV